MKIEKDDRTIQSVEDWCRHAPPKQKIHWADDRSAKELAKSWTLRASMPGKLIDLLHTHPDTLSAVLESAEPEAHIRFDQRSGEPRNADLAIKASTRDGPLAITVEAKADESFDAPVLDVLVNALERSIVNPRSGGLDRVRDLTQSLLPARIDATPSVRDLRYQLLTATAGTLAWARELNALRAVLVIHEFQTQRTSRAKLQANAKDLDLFVERITGGTITSLNDGRLIGPIQVPGRPLFEMPASLYIGKVVEWLSEPQP